MLMVSLALHVSVATGIGLSYFHWTAIPGAASPEVTPPRETVILLRSEETIPFQHPASAMAAVKEIVATPSAALPSPAQPLIEKAVPAPTIGTPAAATQPPALARETNPNALVAALPPEAVLSPSPAPHLNGAEGVVFILDISGSMYEPYAGSTRLAFARQTLSSRIRALKNGTPFAVTLYAEHACASGPLVAANDATREAAVRFIMRDADCGGGTNLPAGLASAQQLHAGALVLVSDGDLNISAINLATKARAILGPEKHCPALTIIGIAPRSTTGDERLLQGLAHQQGGTYRAEKLGSNAAGLVTSSANATKPGSATQ
jgi:hypothetical protein